MQRFSFIHLGLLVAGVAVVGSVGILARYHLAHGEAPEAAAPAPRAMPMASPAATQDPAAAFLLGLSANEVATYTDPVHGFSFLYPAAFRLSTSTVESEDVVYAEHPSLPLAIEVRVSPMAERTAKVEELKALPADYDQQTPDGVDSNVQAWIDESPVPEVPHRGEMWFARHGFLYQVVMQAPDTTLLESWIHEFLYEDLSFSHP
jgi:hypothetical protein